MPQDPLYIISPAGDTVFSAIDSSFSSGIEDGNKSNTPIIREEEVDPYYACMFLGRVLLLVLVTGMLLNCSNGFFDRLLLL